MTSAGIEEAHPARSCCASKTQGSNSNTCDPQECSCGLFQSDTARIEATVQVHNQIEPVLWQLNEQSTPFSLTHAPLQLQLHQVLRPDRKAQQALAQLNVWRC